MSAPAPGAKEALRATKVPPAKDAPPAKESRPATEASPEPDGGARTPRRRWTYRALIASGVAIVLAVGAFQLYATLWNAHSRAAGRNLVHRFLQDQAANAPVQSSGSSGTGTLASCAGSATSTDPVKGLIEIPKLEVTAPVEDGVGDDQLNVAVGHLPNSVWPGQVGNSVLEAHNVSYFVGLSRLVAGDTVLYVAPCTTYVFQVTGHTVVNEGAPVYNTTSPTITMVTCWPTNALWFTPQRYVVTASQIRVIHAGGTGSTYLTTSEAPTVPVPAALAAQGVTLATYSLPMGHFTLSGTPDQAWSQTTNPLLVEDAGVEAFIAGMRSLVENRLDWWGTLAPGVAAPAQLLGAQNPSYLTSLDVTVDATGAQASGLTLMNTIAVTGGKAPGHYTETVQETISNGTLVISSWTLQPA